MRHAEARRAVSRECAVLMKDARTAVGYADDPEGEDGGSGPVPLTELREALAAARIRTLYQPIVRMADRMPVAVEVLARLAHPTRGIVAPDLFVPQIEDAGLALDLTEEVGRAAFADWAANRLARAHLSLGLNFPLDVLLMPAALYWLDATREAAGVPARHVTIELTESRPVSHQRELAAAVARLRRLGYRLAIDDVGPALRDHRSLLDMAFSTVKLDKGVVGEALHCPAARAFVEQAIAAAHDADMDVVAEGIATPAHWARMADLGADMAQGYLVARPLAASQVAGWQRGWVGQTVGVQGPATA